MQKHFPNEDPIGKQLRIGNGQPPSEIVGIVAEVHHTGLDTTANPTMYVPFKQDIFSQMWVLARTDGDPAQLSGVARQSLRELDPALPAFSLTPLATVVSESVAQRRFSMLLLGVFAASRSSWRASGSTGSSLTPSVSARARSGFGWRSGRHHADVLKMVIGGGMKLAVIGVVVGLAGALALTSLIASLLFNVEPFDPASYAVTSILLLAIAALACYVPARRATRVDPIAALHQQ